MGYWDEPDNSAAEKFLEDLIADLQADNAQVEAVHGAVLAHWGEDTQFGRFYRNCQKKDEERYYEFQQEFADDPIHGPSYQGPWRPDWDTVFDPAPGDIAALREAVKPVVSPALRARWEQEERSEAEAAEAERRAEAEYMAEVEASEADAGERDLTPGEMRELLQDARADFAYDAHRERQGLPRRLGP